MLSERAAWPTPTQTAPFIVSLVILFKLTNHLSHYDTLQKSGNSLLACST